MLTGHFTIPPNLSIRSLAINSSRRRTNHRAVIVDLLIKSVFELCELIFLSLGHVLIRILVTVRFAFFFLYNAGRFWGKWGDVTTRWQKISFRNRESTRAVFTYICCLMQVYYVFLLLVTDHMKGTGCLTEHYLFEEGCSRLEIEMRLGTLQLVGSLRQTHWSVASYSSWSPRAFTQIHLWVFPFCTCFLKKQTWLLALLDCCVMCCLWTSLWSVKLSVNPSLMLPLSI